MKIASWFSFSCFIFGLTACAAEAVEQVTDDDAPALGAAATTITWPTVGAGDRSDLVIASQYLLSSRGQAVTADGDFGSGTQAAVIRFQRASGLTADGVIGSSTWEALISDVKLGSFGAGVQAAQQLLVTRIAANVVIDGDAGAATVSAIKRFQGLKCLAQTGVVGRFTWNSLVTGRSYCTTPPAPPPGGSDFCQFSWEERPGYADYTTINWYERSIGDERPRSFDRSQAQSLQGSNRLKGGLCANARLLKPCFDKAVARERARGSAFLSFAAAQGLDPVRVKMAFSFQETFLGELSDNCAAGVCNGVGLAQIITAYPNDDDYATTLSSSDARWDGISYNVLTNLAYSSRVLSEKVLSARPPNLVELARAYNGNPDSRIRLPYGPRVQGWYSDLGACGL